MNFIETVLSLHVTLMIRSDITMPFFNSVGNDRHGWNHISLYWCIWFPDEQQHRESMLHNNNYRWCKFVIIVGIITHIEFHTYGDWKPFCVHFSFHNHLPFTSLKMTQSRFISREITHLSTTRKDFVTGFPTACHVNTFQCNHHKTSP